MKPHGSIVSMGTVTSVGLNANQTAASVRAGINRLSEAPWPGTDGNPYRGGFLNEDLLPGLNRKISGIESHSVLSRLLQLAGLALKEAADSLPSQGEAAGVVIGLKSRESLQGVAPELFLEYLMIQSQIRFDPRSSEVVFGGRAAGLMAVQKAILRIIAGHNGPLIAGGIDSYYEYPRLIDLDFEGRILNETNLDGFIPGEGAGFVTIVPVSWRPEISRLGHVLSFSSGYEPGHLYSEEPMTADGMTKTIAGLFGTVPPELFPCRTAYVNLNGEQVGVKEWSIARMRNQSFLSDDLKIVHPAEAFGDAGSAMGPIMISLGLRGWTRSYHSGPILVTCAADHGECAALYLVPEKKKD